MIARLLNRLRAPAVKSERGAILVITAVAMTAILIMASYAIDTAIWYVHKRHLQTQADAAALAAGQSFQFNCGATGDTNLKAIIHAYDGSGITTPGYNPQVPKPPTSSTTLPAAQSGHVLYSIVNGSNFGGGQTYPGDTGLTGSPCTNGKIDVKLTEQGVPAFLIPHIAPRFLNAEAEVGFQTEETGAGGLPFVEPLPAPTSVAVEFVNEKTGAALATPGVVTMSTTDNGLTWTANKTINFADPTGGSTTDEFPLGMRVAVNLTGSGATFNADGSCPAAETCYDNSTTPPTTPTNPSFGVAFTRVFNNTGTPGLPTTNPVAPQVGNSWLQPCTTSGSSCTTCPSSPSPSVSNFFNSASTISEQLCANVTFTSTGGAPTCANSALTLKEGSTAVTMTCPTGGPNGVWSSGPISVASVSSANILTMGYSLTGGCLPVGATGGAANAGCTQGSAHTGCTSAKPCTGSFDGNTAALPETIQQAYAGAYSLLAGQTAAQGGLALGHSGTIASAAVTDSTGAELQSVQNGSSVNATISLGFYGFQPQSSVSGAPFELSFGGNQGNADLGCNGSNGKPQFQQAIEQGCPGTYQRNTLEPDSVACPGGSTTATPGPATCVSENPGNGKSGAIGPALNDRINGSLNTNTCSDPNYWVSPNSVGSILSRTVNGAPDPRLVTLFYTDNGELTNGSANVPIRGFAKFYITGWGGGTDPCLSVAHGGHSTLLDGAKGTDANGLSFTTDDLPPDNSDGVVMGHFVTYVDSTGTSGTGTACTNGTLDVCIPVLLK